MNRTTTTKSNGRAHSNLHQDYKKIKSALTHTAKNLKGKTRQKFYKSLKNVKHKSVLVQDNVADYVAEKPFQSLGISVLAGMVIGYLMHK